MNRARKSAIVEKASVVSETPPLFDCEGMETLAGALCLVAAGAHSKSAAEQEQIGAAFFNCAITGFEGVKTNDAVTAFVKDMIDKARRK